MTIKELEQQLAYTPLPVHPDNSRPACIIGKKALHPIMKELGLERINNEDGSISFAGVSVFPVHAPVNHIIVGYYEDILALWTTLYRRGE
jgi:hypothetical protein